MFKIDIYLRFALIVGLSIAGIALAIWLGFWYGFPLLLIALVLLVGYFIMGTVMSAAELLQAQRVDEAEKRLKLTFFPNLLYSANRSYYYMVQANIAMMRNDPRKAEDLLKQASSISMPSGNEAAVVQLQLAHIAAKKGAWPEVNQRLQQIRKLKVTEPMISEQIEQLTQVYNNRGNVRLAQSPQMRGQMQGGKRRRPRLR